MRILPDLQPAGTECPAAIAAPVAPADLQREHTL